MASGKIVAVTGAGSGIGAATALFLAQRGMRVVLGSRGDRDLNAVAERIAAAGGEAATLSIDVAKRDDMVRFVALAEERFGGLDVLISNAGVMPVGPVDDLAVEDWERMVDVNVKGVLFGVAAALPLFRRQGRGHFINIASTAARKIQPNMAVYSATKAAVAAFSDGLRQELAGDLRVTTLFPGFVDTNFAAHVNNEKVRSDLAAAGSRYAMDPSCVAAAIAYAMDQPDDVNIGEIVIRSKAQP